MHAHEIEDAPKLIDFIRTLSLAHFDGLQRLARGPRGSPTKSTRGLVARP